MTHLIFFPLLQALVYLWTVDGRLRWFLFSLVYFLFLIGIDFSVVGDYGSYISGAKSYIWSNYFLKEGVFWLLLRLLYSLFGENCISVLVCSWYPLLMYQCWRLKRFELVSVLVFSIPFLLLEINAVRQGIALSILMLAYFQSRSFFSFLLFLISVFVHNSMLLFFPFVFCRFFNGKLFLIFYVCYSVIFIFIVSYYKNTNSSGFDSALVYFLALILVAFMVCFFFRFKTPDFSLVYLFWVGLLAFLFLEGSNAERIMMSCFVLLFVGFVKVESYFNRSVLFFGAVFFVSVSLILIGFLSQGEIFVHGY